MLHTKALVRKEGQAKFKGLKMKVKLENCKLGKHSKNNGIVAMHHFRFEKLYIKRLPHPMLLPVVCNTAKQINMGGKI